MTHGSPREGQQRKARNGGCQEAYAAAWTRQIQQDLAGLPDLLQRNSRREDLQRMARRQRPAQTWA